MASDCNSNSPSSNLQPGDLHLQRQETTTTSNYKQQQEQHADEQQLQQLTSQSYHLTATTTTTTTTSNNNTWLLCQPSVTTNTGDPGSSGLCILTETSLPSDHQEACCNNSLKGTCNSPYQRPTSISMSSITAITPVPVNSIDTDQGPPPRVGTIEYLQRCQRARRREEQIQKLEEQRLREIIAFCEEYNRESELYFEQQKRANPTPEPKLHPKYIFSPKKGLNLNHHLLYNMPCESTYSGGSFVSSVPSTSTYSFAYQTTSLNKSDEGPIDLSKSGAWSTDSVTSNSSSPSSSTITSHTLPSVHSSFVNCTPNGRHIHPSITTSNAMVTSPLPQDLNKSSICQLTTVATASSETLNALLMESACLQSELERLRESKPGDSDDLDNESLKEFQLMEKEIRMKDLTNSLKKVEELIREKQSDINKHNKIPSSLKRVGKEAKVPLNSSCSTNDAHASSTPPFAPADSPSDGPFCRSNGTSGLIYRNSLRRSKPIADFDESDDDSDTLTETEDNSSDSTDDASKHRMGQIDARKASSLPPSDLHSVNHSLNHNKRAFSVKPSGYSATISNRSGGTFSNSSSNFNGRAMSANSNLSHSHTGHSGLIAEMLLLGHNLSCFTNDDVQLTCCTCSGYLWKLTSNKKKWKRRFFHFDRYHRVFFYYKSVDQFRKVKKPNGGVTFADLRDVCIDRSRSVKDDSNENGKNGHHQRQQQSPHLPISPLTRSNSVMRASFRSLKNATLGRRNKKKEFESTSNSSSEKSSQMQSLSKSSEHVFTSSFTSASSMASSVTATTKTSSPSSTATEAAVTTASTSGLYSNTATRNGSKALELDAKKNVASKNCTKFSDGSSNNNIFSNSHNSTVNNKSTLSNAHSFVFVVDTAKRSFVLSSHSWQLMRLWIDVIFTGVDSYCD